MKISDELLIELYSLDLAVDIDAVNWNELNWRKLFVEASNNRILDIICKRMLQDIRIKPSIPHEIEKFVMYVIDEGNTYINKTKKSLIYLNEILNKEKIPFLIAKTQKIFDYVTFDVDVLIHEHNYDTAIKLLKSAGGTYVNCDAKLQGDIILSNMARIDMHKGFHWQKSTFLDNNFILQNPIKREVFGIECYTPNMEAEAILTMLNLIYERNYIPLLEYHYLRQISWNLDWGKIFSISRNYNWNNALIVLLTKFNEINQLLFNEDFIDLTEYGFNSKNNIELHIPYIFSFMDLFTIYSERLIKCKYIPYFELFYSIYAKSRFHIGKGERVPIYGHWVDFTKIDK
jgi:hypothetical protein